MSWDCRCQNMFHRILGWTFHVTLYERKGDIICERFVELVSLITSKDIHERIFSGRSINLFSHGLFILEGLPLFGTLAANISSREAQMKEPGATNRTGLDLSINDAKMLTRPSSARETFLLDVLGLSLSFVPLVRLQSSI